MNVRPIKTRIVSIPAPVITDFLDESVDALQENSIVAISSKVVAITEGRVVPISSIDRETLVKQEADYYLPPKLSPYGHHFTITKKTLIASAGIDKSNADGHYILWPADPQKSANQIRVYFAKRFDLKNIGVIITDSTCTPLRYGTSGICLAHSGFLAINDYRGTPDLFSRPLEVTRAGVAGGLAAAACLSMGEGNEQTPIVIIEDVPFVSFQPRDPSAAELDEYYIADKDDDLFAPFLNSVQWQKGNSGKS